MASQRVYIVGYMGAGKSTSGRRLAALMDLPFFDTDEELRRDSGQTVTALFDAEGEAVFRQRERAMLESLTQAHDRVLISTGGGTPCFGDNMAYMRSHGTVVYLQMAVDRLVQRLEGRVDERPLIAGIPSAELPAFIARHLEERVPFYSQAHMTVDADHLDRDRMKSIRNLLEGRTWLNP